MTRALAVTLITIAAVTGCKKDQTYGDDTTTKAAAGASAASTPAPASVTITSPAKGATTGTDVIVTLRATGVTIAKADGGKAENVGHHHLFLDTIPTADNVPIPPMSAKIDRNTGAALAFAFAVFVRTGDERGAQPGGCSGREIG